MTGPPDVIVIGGGIAGVAITRALGLAGKEVLLLEQAQQFGEIGAGIQLGPNAVRSLDRLGVWEDLRPLAVTPRSTIVMDAVRKERLTALDFGDRFVARYGYPYVVTHRHDLLEALVAAARRTPGVTMQTNARVVTVEDGPDHATVHLEGGASIRSTVVVGADGIHSKVRRLHDDSEPLFTGQVAYRGTVPIADADLGFDPTDMILWIGPNRHLIQYPVRGGQLYNQVAVFESGWAKDGRAGWGERAELAEVFADSCDTVLAALDLFDSHRVWPIYDRDPLTSWVTQHTVLIGDAAHAMRQYLAQGACQALEDVLVLTHELVHHREPQDAFRTYQERRLAKTTKCQLVARPWGDLWHTTDPMVTTLRDRYFRLRADDDYSELDWLYADHVGHGVPHASAHERNGI
ncbi:FAD-dependent monooxygenase [Pseudonocardia sp. NPDC049635]|uniref:FAD-dependent monooxygenase n=1 Tax=Pseudonocardia sp. NPDC049635 TaxID=3155506 RepID=UPI0033E0F242